MSPSALTAVASISSIFGLLGVLAYLYVSVQSRRLERSVRETVEGEGLFNSTQILEILKEFETDEKRLEALAHLTNLDKAKARAVLRKVEGNIDIERLQRLTHRQGIRVAGITGLVLLLLGLFGIVASRQQQSEEGSGTGVYPPTAQDPGRFALRTEHDTFHSEVGHNIDVPLRVLRLATGNVPPTGFALRTTFLEEDGTPLDQDSVLRAFIRESSEARLPPMAEGTHEQTANLRIGTQEAGRFRLRIGLAVDNDVLTSLELGLVVDSLPLADLVASSTAEIPHFLLRNHLLTLEEGVFEDYEEVAVTLVDEAYRSNLEQATIYLDPTHYGSTGPTFDIYSYPLPEGQSHRGYHRSPLGTTFADTVPIGAGFYAFEQIDARRLRFIPVPAHCRQVRVRLDRSEHFRTPSESAPQHSLVEIAINDYRSAIATFSIVGSEESFSLYYDCGAGGATCHFELQWGESVYLGSEDSGALDLATSTLPIIRDADRGAYWMIEAHQAGLYDTRLTASRCQPGTAS